MFLSARLYSLPLVHIAVLCFLIAIAETTEVISTDEEDDTENSFQVITEEERTAASQKMAKEIWTYVYWTLAGVVFFIMVAICFVVDPLACVIAFGMGSPCLMLCPCYRKLISVGKNPMLEIRDKVNIFVPGVYIDDERVVGIYIPTAEELQALVDLVKEIGS